MNEFDEANGPDDAAIDMAFDPNEPDDFGARIAAAVAPYRPNPGEFTRGVDERLETRSNLPSPWLQRVAAMLPPIISPLATPGGSIAGAASKSSAWKLVPGVLALPAAVIVAVLLTFVFAVRRAFVGGRQRTDQAEADAGVMCWWMDHWWQAIAVAVGVFVLGRYAPMDGVVIGLGVSMVALVAVVGMLASHGLASRGEIGRRSAGLLGIGSMFGVHLLGASTWSDRFDPTSVSAGLLALALGALVCGVLAGRAGGGWRPYFIGIWFGVAVVVVVVYSQHRVFGRPVDRAEARTEVERRIEKAESIDWRRLAPVLWHLHASEEVGAGTDSDGDDRPWSDRVAGRLHVDIDRLGAEDPDAWPPRSLALEELGLFREEDLRSLRSDRLVTSAFEQRSQFIYLRRAALGVAVRHRLGVLGADARRSAATKAWAGLDEPREHGVLEELVAADRVFAVTGDKRFADRMRERVHAALRATWTGRPNFRRAAFAPSYSLVERNARGHSITADPSSIWLDATDHAVRLMIRYGVPEGVDLGALDRYLRKESEHRPGRAMRTGYLLAGTRVRPSAPYRRGQATTRVVFSALSSASAWHGGRCCWRCCA